MSNISEKQNALAKEIGCEPKEIEFSEKYGEFRTPDGTFTVMDEEEAKKAHLEYIESVIDDIGIEAFTPSFQEEILSDYIKQDDFEEINEESNENYAKDIKYETYQTTYANRLIDECVDAHIIVESDLTEDGEYEGDLDLEDELKEYLCKRDKADYEGNFAKWYSDSYGESELTTYVRNHSDVLDVQSISEACIDADGLGHSLASWDGVTREQDGFYIFKQDEYDDRSKEFVDGLKKKENIERE